MADLHSWHFVPCFPSERSAVGGSERLAFTFLISRLFSIEDTFTGHMHMQVMDSMIDDDQGD
jgi:hypothetical protein